MPTKHVVSHANKIGKMSGKLVPSLGCTIVNFVCWKCFWKQKWGLQTGMSLLWLILKQSLKLPHQSGRPMNASCDELTNDAQHEWMEASGLELWVDQTCTIWNLYYMNEWRPMTDKHESWVEQTCTTQMSGGQQLTSMSWPNSHNTNEWRPTADKHELW